MVEEGIKVVLLLPLGKYFADVHPDPSEADKALGLVALTPYTSFLYSSTVNFLLSSTEVEITLLHTVSSSGLWKALTTS